MLLGISTKLAALLLWSLLLLCLAGSSPLQALTHPTAISSTDATHSSAQKIQKPVNSTRPVLVLLPEVGASAGLHRLRGTYRVVSLLEPRIAILEVSEGELTQLRQDRSIAAVYQDTIPPEVLQRLHPQERLFVKAWNLQRATQGKGRPGEGLPWDAPGFQAPGPPSRERP
jgi:hypothetical protein